MGETRSGGFCTQCGHIIENFDGLDACPACNTHGLPCSWSEQVTVSVNWHELRILAIWAENWARQHKASDPSLSRTVYSIANRLQAQHNGKVPLTLAGELGELKDHFPSVSTNDPALRQDVAEQTGRELGLIRPPMEQP